MSLLNHFNYSLYSLLFLTPVKKITGISCDDACNNIKNLWLFCHFMSCLVSIKI